MMWLFGMGSSSPEEEEAAVPLDTSSMEVTSGPDGVANDVPAIAYTEQVIAEKEASLKKYIQDQYAKLSGVEKELEALRMEVKLTSGSKKAAMELLKRRIEESAERIKAAKLKEEQAKQAWDAAAKALKEEEDNKQQLCEDLRHMVQWSAMQQYERLENLTKKLDALNPEMKGMAMAAVEGLRAQIAPHGPPILVNGTASGSGSPGQSNGPETASGSAVAGEGKAVGEKDTTGEGTGGAPGQSSSEEQQDKENSNSAANGNPGALTPERPQGSHVQLKGHQGRGRRGRGIRARGNSSRDSSGGWTGAGFDVEDSGQ